MEAYQQERFHQKIGTVHFIQDNEVHSRLGVIRGLHFQKGKNAQAKLVRVTQGNIIDIVVDLRSCLLYTSPSPRDLSTSRMPSSA